MTVSTQYYDLMNLKSQNDELLLSSIASAKTRWAVSKETQDWAEQVMVDRSHLQN